MAGVFGGMISTAEQRVNSSTWLSRATMSRSQAPRPLHARGCSVARIRGWNRTTHAKSHARAGPRCGSPLSRCVSRSREISIDPWPDIPRVMESVFFCHSSRDDGPVQAHSSPKRCNRGAEDRGRRGCKSRVTRRGPWNDRECKAHSENSGQTDAIWIQNSSRGC